MNLKNIGIVVVILALLAGGYFVLPSFFPASPAPSSSLQTAEGVPVANAKVNGALASSGREFARTLVNLESLKLDENIFSNPLFLSLVDFSVELQPQPKGRRNPFAPLGTDTTPAPASAPASISTAVEGE